VACNTKKAIQVNAELIFPFLSNHNMKIHLFYDAGCAWDTPKTAVIQDNASHIKSDSFHMRHTIGIGLNIVSPQPMKISFGYKLDRNKRIGESPSEFHIGMNTAF
jgi:outer membrane protein assembly factor BamA